MEHGEVYVVVPRIHFLIPAWGRSKEGVRGEEAR
jgi:hypothetical protein